MDRCEAFGRGAPVIHGYLRAGWFDEPSASRPPEPSKCIPDLQAAEECVENSFAI